MGKFLKSLQKIPTFCRGIPIFGKKLTVQFMVIKLTVQFMVINQFIIYTYTRDVLSYNSLERRKEEHKFRLLCLLISDFQYTDVMNIRSLKHIVLQV